MPNRQQILVGQRLLKRLLPAAIDQATHAGDAMKFSAESAIAKTMQAYLKVENLHSLVIYEGERGGWHLDIMFRNMPPGVPTVMGSPVAHPHHSRQKAFESAPFFLTGIVRMCLDAPKMTKKDPVFQFHDIAFRLRSELLAFLVEHRIQETGYDVEKRLKATDEKFFPNGCTFEAFEALSTADQAEIMSVVHCSAAFGNHFRYPAFEAKPPNETKPFDLPEGMTSEDILNRMREPEAPAEQPKSEQHAEAHK